MWAQHDYNLPGAEHFSMDIPHNVLPKPLPGEPIPPIWVACGNPPTFEKGRPPRHRRHRLQTFKPIHDMKPMIDA